MIGASAVGTMIEWYDSFYDPDEMDGAFWIGRRANWGRVGGGHAIPAPDRTTKDRKSWHAHYDQGSEGACAGFAGSRERSWIERRMFDGFDLYRRAQLRDGFGPPDPARGTSMRAMGEALQEEGPTRKGDDGPDGRYRIGSFWWAQSWDEVRTILGIPASQGYVEPHNSSGDDYPQKVRIADEAGVRLLREDGEAMILVDEKGIAA